MFRKQSLERRISAVRRFNRGFAKTVGLLQGSLLEPFSLTEARILFEIGNHTDLTASDLSNALGTDAGHLSRILSRLESNGAVVRVQSDTDGRQRFLHLTETGKKALDTINLKADEQVAQLLQSLSEPDQERLLSAMDGIGEILWEENAALQSFVLRPHEPGDMGWIIQRHGVVYAEEYGWNEEFEAFVARVCADFLSNHNAKRERCWIAELKGEPVGSVLIAQTEDRDVARLRVFLVEPEARGRGLGASLIEECVRFAKRSGYRKITLQTYNVLTAARRLYEKAGFQMIGSEERREFGQELIEQDWELAL